MRFWSCLGLLRPLGHSPRRGQAYLWSCALHSGHKHCPQEQNSLVTAKGTKASEAAWARMLPAWEALALGPEEWPGAPEKAGWEPGTVGRDACSCQRAGRPGGLEPAFSRPQAGKEPCHCGDRCHAVQLKYYTNHIDGIFQQPCL